MLLSGVCRVKTIPVGASPVWLVCVRASAASAQLPHVGEEASALQLTTARTLKQAFVAAATLLLGFSRYILLCQERSLPLHHAFIYV